MGISCQNDPSKKHQNILKMKSFVAFVALLAAANADVSSHASVKHGHSEGYSHEVSHAPAYHAAPAYKAAPAYHPARFYAPVYHAAPLYHAPAYKAPVYHAPAYKAPVYHAPAYKEPEHVAPKYAFGYSATGDYAGVNFAANESRDGYATSGEYRVNLPDCRTQIVKYNTADGYSGNVVEVTYEGTPCSPEEKAVAYKAPAYKAPAPAYHA